MSGVLFSPSASAQVIAVGVSNSFAELKGLFLFQVS